MYSHLYGLAWFDIPIGKKPKALGDQQIWNS